MKPTIWFCETWVQEFWIFYRFDAKDVEKYCAKRGMPDIDLKQEGGVRFRVDGSGPIVLWVSKLKKKGELIEILAHEAVHAAHVCLSRRGVVADFTNDEPVTYLTQRLVRKALDAG